MKITRFVTLLSAVIVTSAVPAIAAEARIQIALLDGAPVYHWRVFKSRYSDDIDRALVLREFKRRGFTLPVHFVEEALQREIAEKYNGSSASLEQSLHRSGASMDDYRRFLAEEITLTAFPIFVARQSKVADSPAAQAKWVASLRKSAKVELLR